MNKIIFCALGVAALAVAAFAQGAGEAAGRSTTTAAAAGTTQPVDEKRVAELVRLLGDDNYRVREDATKKLIAMGPAVNPLLSALRGKPRLDPEIAWRIELVLASTGTLALDLGNKVTMKLVLIPAGKFLMGSPAGEKDRDANEGPQHAVTISKPFYMGVYSVTQEQWKQVMGTTLAQQRDKANKAWKFYGDGPVYPMYYVSWNDAVEFCKRLSRKSGRTVRLPTEAQWEYACRAGSATRFYYGDDRDYATLSDYAWCRVNSGSVTHPVGQRKPNEWGLYDMHGNSWQWCADWYGKDYGAKANATDPAGPASGTLRVLRGGGCFDEPSFCRAAIRRFIAPEVGGGLFGFRVIVDLK